MGQRCRSHKRCSTRREAGKVADRDATASVNIEMVALLNTSTDFYKKMALDCSGQQVAMDLFMIAS